MESTGPLRTGIKNTPTITDTFGRSLDYLRLAVTDRCNLRCTYCMPEVGIPLKSHTSILRYEEMDRLVRLLASMGVQKVRITGGEPMVRKGITDFIRSINMIPGISGVYLTTNGFWSDEQIAEIDSLELSAINLSLDSLIPERFFKITRRNAFARVWQTLLTILDHGIPVKINNVVQRGVNDDEIQAFAEMARDKNIQIRFIEQMPFNGEVASSHPISAEDIHNELLYRYPNLREHTPSGSTARLFHIPGFKGQVGIIAGYSRTFCSTCNRLRITSYGQLKTCLYDGGLLDLRAMLRNDEPEAIIAAKISEAISMKPLDGFEAESQSQISIKSSMATLGG